VRIEIRGAERLSFRERQVVALKEMGLGNEAVARRLGIAVATVATLFNRARQKGYQVVMVLDGDPLSLFSGEGEDAESPEEEEA
jgi:transposase